MRISDKYKLIFVSTPKSGSHTGWKLMEENFPINNSSMHNNIVPENKTNYNAFTFVRNPYERAVALWHSVLWTHLSKNKKQQQIGQRYRKEFMKRVGADDFSSFCKYLASLDRNKPGDFYRHLIKSQTHYHSVTNLKNLKYFKIENIKEELPKYLLDVTGIKIKEIPHELKRNHETWKDLYTEENKSNIIKWAEEDFTLYKYEF